MPEPEERNNQPSIKVVFLDSNCLVRGGERTSDFKELLRLAKEKKIKLITSWIVVEEWISNIRDEYIASLMRLRGDLRGNSLYAAATVADCVNNIPKAAQAWSDTDRRAQEYVKKFIDDNDIDVVDPGSDHIGRVFRKYCGWKPPFSHSEQFTEIDNEEFRNARKENFPDAFIIETIIDYGQRIPEFYVVSADGDLRNALPDNIQRNTYPLRKIIDVLEPPAPPAAPTTPELSPPTPPIAPTAPQSAETTTLTEAASAPQALSSTTDIEKLPDRVLGYLLWLSGGTSGVPKEVLSKHLRKKGYIDDQINEMGANFVATGALKDTGNHYIVIDKQLARAAANSIRTEILELLRD